MFFRISFATSMTSNFCARGWRALARFLCDNTQTTCDAANITIDRG